MSESPQPVVDTNVRPPAKATPDLAAIAAVYIAATRSGRRPIEALMEKFNVDRASAKPWPELCREAGLLPPRDQPQVAADPDDIGLGSRMVS